MTSATQQGVQKSPNEITAEQQAAVDAARKSTLQDRQTAMNELADSRKEARDAELQAEGHAVVDTSGEKDAGDDDDEGGATAKNAADDTKTSQNPDTKLENTEEFVTLKIDGKEQQVPKSKIFEAGTRAMQKELASDTRLEEATRILNEAREIAGRSQPSKGNADVDDTAGMSDIDKKALAKSLVDGDVDEVAEALGKIMGTGRQTKLATQAVNMQPNEVYSMVDSALQLKEAMNTFQADPLTGGYGDLYADETTRQMVFDKEAALAEADKEGKTTSMSRLKQAADEVRQWRNGLIEKAGGKVVQFDQRTDRKANSQSTVSTSGGRLPEKQTEQPKTEAEKRREALAKMSRSRGQHLD